MRSIKLVSRSYLQHVPSDRSTYDYFGDESHPDYSGITDEQRENRMILRDAMMRHGFKPIATEWWHFTLKDEPYPDTYFTFPVNSDSVSD